MIPKESLISKEEVIMKNNDKVIMCAVDLSENMAEHVVHQMQFDLELGKIYDVGCHPEFQSKPMKYDADDKEDVF